MRRVAKCNRCTADIAFCWNTESDRWCAVDISSLDDARDEPFEGGVYLERWHVFHRCARRQPPKPPAPDPLATAFATLHLLPTAPKPVVQAAYRALAMIHHPDRGGDPERMLAVNLAWEKLR